MRSLHPRIPLPSLLPKGWPIIVTDLQDGFFTIPLQEQDRENFAYTTPIYNKAQPVRRYHWDVLSQGMLNSPVLCQYFIN